MLEETDLIEAVRRYFERKHRGKVRMFYPEAIKRDWKSIDALFVQARKDCIHIVEAEPSVARVFDPNHGFAQLAKHKGNYKWLAISKEVYEDGKTEIRRECKRNEIGLLVISGRERFTVEEKLKRYKKGTFLPLYPDAYKEWQSG